MFSSMQWRTRRLAAWRTTTHVVVLVVMTLMASIAFLTFLHVRAASHAAHQERTDFAVAQARTIEKFLDTVGGDLHSPQLAERIQHLAEDVGHEDGLEALLFVDRDGIVLAPSDTANIGSLYRNPDMMAALNSGNIAAAKETDSGFSRLDVTVPIRHGGIIVGGIEARFSLESLDSGIAEVEKDALFSAVAVALALIPITAIVIARLQKALEQMAITDGLTGLFDYRYFRMRLDHEIKRAARYGGNLSLILIDLDGFKSYNDTYGHQAGDEAIKLVAQTIKQNIREVDIASRYGGEEFTIILPETGLEGAYLVAERVRKALCVRFEVVKNPGALTASFGVASYPSDASTIESLIRCTDAALYHAKLLGKNRSCTYPSLPEQTAVKSPTAEIS